MDSDKLKIYKKSIIIGGLIIGIIYALYCVGISLAHNVNRHLWEYALGILWPFVVGFLVGGLITMICIYLKSELEEEAFKGLIIGSIITGILILIPSYNAPKHNYDLAKRQYTDYNFVVQNCGNDPSNNCLKNLCIGKAYDGFCEGVNRQDTGYEDPATFWRNHKINMNKEPSVFVLLIPNINDGLSLFLMFGIFGLLVLISPMAIGFFIGKKIHKNKV